MVRFQCRPYQERIFKDYNGNGHIVPRATKNVVCRLGRQYSKRAHGTEVSSADFLDRRHAVPGDARWSVVVEKDVEDVPFF